MTVTDTIVTDPVPPSAYPQFQPVTSPAPVMPKYWTATVLLHPFGPPQSNNPKFANPFSQLCVASIVYAQGAFLSAQVSGCSDGSPTWWYIITPINTQISTDGGAHWNIVDMGWSLPQDWYGAQGPNAACAGAAPLNWMNAQTVEWWKIPVPISSSLDAATWMWFDSSTHAPVRMMFGQGPSSPSVGDPTQLAFFQMWSFAYVPVFQSYDDAGAAPARPQSFVAPSFPGFAKGNPDNYDKFVWNTNFGMTAFMTPVNEVYNPLPTRVLYVWKPADQYELYSDRAQNTLMMYNYNQPNSINMASQEALLTGPAPEGVTPPPNSGTGFLINFLNDGTSTCVGGSQFPFPQEPPNWITIPAVDATIHATITNNPVLAPNTTVTIFSVLFPPSPPNYPEATYLWTWYSPQNASGSQSRPVTFMQSQSGVNLGTSLALADYYYYQPFDAPIDPSNFDIPSSCSAQTRKVGLRFRLP